MIVKKSFFHYGTTWYHCLINLDKLKLWNNQTHYKFRKLITNVILADKVPNEYFTEDARRCYNAKELIPSNLLERPARYKKLIEQALETRGELSRHYVVEKALLEAPQTNFVVAELPVWLPEGRRVGHIDLIELAEGKPSILVWDYKPNAEEELPTGQIQMYAVILAQMLKVPLFEIQAGWFDQSMEVLVV